MGIMADTFNYEIVEHLATLSESESGYTMELNKISYRGGYPKFDLRKWDRRQDKMLKGVTLTDEEATILKEALIKAI